MNTKHLFLSLVLFTATALNLFAQTPGMIYDPATGGGAAVLDPNGDGYTSATTSGFSTSDQTESEIPYKPVPVPQNEPNSDLGPGPNCSFTDFVQSTANNQDPVLSYLYPSAPHNWCFRFRMGGSSPNSKSYSVLIDTDQKFGASGPNKDPNWVSGNPGFEIEIVLATNFGVYVYNVDGTSSPGAAVLSYTSGGGHDYYQKSIALSTICSDPDYFYDFYLPFDDIASTFSITRSTPLRMTIIDNMAANKSTINNSTSASDLAGVNDAAYGYDYPALYDSIISNFPASPVDSVNTWTGADISACPTINYIAVGATTVSGTSTEAVGSTIKVYKNSSSTPIGTTTVQSGGTWSISGVSPALALNDTITATCQATGKGVSINNCSTIYVGAPCPPADPVISCSSAKGFTISNGEASGSYTLYNMDGSLNTETATNPQPGNSGTVLFKCNGSTTGCNSGPSCFNANNYFVTVTVNGCVSNPVQVCNAAQTASTPVSKSPATIYANTTTITGTSGAANDSVFLFSNGFLIARTKATAGSAFTFSNLSLTAGAVLTIRENTNTLSKCLSAPLSAGTVQTVLNAPVIFDSYCIPSSQAVSISGSQNGPRGTTIKLYKNSSTTSFCSTTTADSLWTASCTVAPGDTIRAKAGTGADSSVYSSYVVIGTQDANSVTITTNPIYEGGTSVSGTGTNGETIKLYIDNTQIGSSTTVSGGTWTISGLSAANYDLYAGGIVKAGTSTGGQCENYSATKTVQCNTPSNALTINPADTSICNGSIVASVRITSSENNIVYQLYNAGTRTGVSKIGTGSVLTLTSGTISSSTTLKVLALKIGALACSDTLTDNLPVTVNANPSTSLTVSVASSPICEGYSTTIDIASSQAGFNYQLKKISDSSDVGVSVAGTGGTINLPTGNLSATTQFFITVTGGTPTFCTDTLDTEPTVTVNPSPTITSTTPGSRMYREVTFP